MKHNKDYRYQKLLSSNRLPILLRTGLSSLPEASWELLSCLSWCDLAAWWSGHIPALKVVWGFWLRNSFLVCERKKERKKERSNERKKERSWMLLFKHESTAYGYFYSQEPMKISWALLRVCLLLYKSYIGYPTKSLATCDQTSWISPEM